MIGLFGRRMYSLTLVLHAWWRWAVLLLALLATSRGLRGILSGGAWTEADRRANMLSTIALDVQTLLGLLLYVFLSPLTARAFQDFAAALRTPSVRYWVVEHISITLAAVILAHIGSVTARRAVSDRARHVRTALFFGAVALLVLLGMPWPGRSNGRPLFRLGM